MTSAEKLEMVKTLLRITDTSEDDLIMTYLTMAEQEIMTWRYSYASVENVPDELPREFEMTQIQAVVNGYTQSGVEGQMISVENGIHRHFLYTDMVEYIHAHVAPVVRVL